MKRIAILPTLLTLGNGVCGLVAITYAAKISIPNDNPTLLALNENYFAAAGWFILFGMVFDMLDGYVARLSKTASEFGGELDSLCDVVTFGITPAFLLLKLGPGSEPNPFFLYQLLFGIAALYFCCAAIRLARFNVDNTPDPSGHKRFKGLPSPGAAGCIAALAILRGEFPKTLHERVPNIDPEAARETITRIVVIASPLAALIVALLMVSNVPFPHVTGKVFRGKKRIGRLVQVLLAGVILVMFHSLAPLLIFWIYAVVFPLRAVLVRNLRPEPEPTPPADEHVAK